MNTQMDIEKPVIGILLGDATGIGPELVAKLVAQGLLNKYCYPIIIGDKRVLEMGMKIAGVQFPIAIIEDVNEAKWDEAIPVLDLRNLDPSEIKLGEVNSYSGKITGDMLITAVELYKAGKIDGFSFAPLNKEAMKKGGYTFESEQYLFAHHFNWHEPFGEVNVLGDLWTSRVTSHIPIKEVSNNLTIESILRAIRLADSTLKRSGINQARIAIAALNPHAGENGSCGIEEIDVIKPAMKEAEKEGIKVIGPYPADILFIKAFEGEFDAVVTMYHDQGQIAMKIKGFDQGITIASGFPAPIVTASHGTAYDIVGKGIAKTSAFENAVKMTARIALCDKKAKAYA